MRAVLSFGPFIPFIIAFFGLIFCRFLFVVSSAIEAAAAKKANANVRIPNENNEMHQKLWHSFFQPCGDSLLCVQVYTMMNRNEEEKKITMFETKLWNNAKNDSNQRSFRLSAMLVCLSQF